MTSSTDENDSPKEVTKSLRTRLSYLGTWLIVFLAGLKPWKIGRSFSASLSIYFGCRLCHDLEN
jgi:hypothetical protein